MDPAFPGAGIPCDWNNEMTEVLIARYGYRHEAELAQGFLRDAGIPCRVASDDAGGVDLSISFLAGASLFVAEVDLEAAVEILKMAGQAGGPEGVG